MDERSGQPFLIGLVEAVGRQTPADVDALAGVLIRRCWPGGPADRTEPAALPWVRRWGPTALTPVPPACSCAEGRCSVCN
jgi:hypothetical protein